MTTVTLNLFVINKTFLVYFLFNIPLAFFVGWVGKKFPIGFWHAFLLSLVVSGVLGIYITVMYGSTKEDWQEIDSD